MSHTTMSTMSNKRLCTKVVKQRRRAQIGPPPVVAHQPCQGQSAINIHDNSLERIQGQDARNFVMSLRRYLVHAADSIHAAKNTIQHRSAAIRTVILYFEGVLIEGYLLVPSVATG